MNVEQRLVAALRSADQVVPSPDLWSRVVHSIEEDRSHRRRVVVSAIAVVAVAAGLVVVGLLGLTDAPAGAGAAARQVRPAVMELIETIALVMLVAVLGPAIRRFGRGYAGDLWRATPRLASALLRLLDIAYLLVFCGFILLTTELDFERSITVAGQLEEMGVRLGGLLLVVGLLHSITIAALPVVAFVSNSTRTGRALPRWFVILLVLIAIVGGPPVMMMLIGGIVDSGL